MSIPRHPGEPVEHLGERTGHPTDRSVIGAAGGLLGVDPVSEGDDRSVVAVWSRLPIRAVAARGPKARLTRVTRTPVVLLSSPYDSGHRGKRMGAGPQTLLEAGASGRLRANGHHVREQAIEPESSWRAERQTAFELQRQIAAAAAGVLTDGRVPLLLAGNCNATIGMLAALQPTRTASTHRRVGLIWFDAHGDFNTPDIDPYGFFDGQALAMAVGRCWQALTSTVPASVRSAIALHSKNVKQGYTRCRRACGRLLPHDQGPVRRQGRADRVDGRRPSRPADAALVHRRAAP